MSNAVDGGMLVPVPSMAQMFPSGNYVDLLAPDPAMIEAEDIAHHLSMLCRYGGGVRRFYSVAEHCVLVAELLAWQGKHPEIVRAGLLHDAAEAYAGDIIAPLKWAMRVEEARKRGVDIETEDNGQWFVRPPAQLRGVYSCISDRLDHAIAEAFDLDFTLLDHPDVKLADMWALKIEAFELTFSRGAGWRWPGTLPNHGLKPYTVAWAGGRSSFSAAPAWLRALEAL